MSQRKDGHSLRMAELLIVFYNTGGEGKEPASSTSGEGGQSREMYMNRLSPCINLIVYYDGLICVFESRCSNVHKWVDKFSIVHNLFRIATKQLTRR